MLDLNAVPEGSVVLVLDNIRSLHNVGAIFRTADGAGCAGVILCGITGQPPRAEIRKAALGAEQTIPWDYLESTEEALEILRDHGFQLIALERNATSADLAGFDIKASARIALVLGNEFYGLSEDIMQRCDAVCHLPMRGSKASLNVSVACGIAAYRLTEQLNAAASGNRER